jgi:hypothetical protein
MLLSQNPDIGLFNTYVLDPDDGGSKLFETSVTIYQSTRCHIPEHVVCVNKLNVLKILSLAILGLLVFMDVVKCSP